MKRILLLYLLSGIDILYLPAQISNINWEWINNNTKIEITYDLPETADGKEFNVTVFVSLDGGGSYSDNPLSLVTGDIGKGVKAGLKKRIVWDVFKEIPDFGGTIVFEVKAKVTGTIDQKRYFIGYKGSFTAPIGIVAGISGKTGFYVSSRLNANSFKNVSEEISGNQPPPGWSLVPGGEVKNQRFSISLGLQPKIANKVHLFAGVGYTKYTVLWQIYKDNSPGVTEWAKQTDESFNSIEIESGLFFQFNKVFLSAGLTWYNKKYLDFIFAAGFLFK